VVTLINCFEVPEGRDDVFFNLWREVNAYMRTKPGYRRHRLHRAKTPGAHYRFVNVADWDSPEQFEAAHDDGFKQLAAKPEWREFPSTPNLFEVIHENQA
jgi:heme-degrading monooxygenase HmoA